MNLLLDSHSFIWWREEPNKLSKNAYAEISNFANNIFLSIASVWEIQIKIKNNKFAFSEKLVDVIIDEQINNGFQLLPINLSHALYLENLPLHHKDPFDRLLISQAIVENMTFITADPEFAKYQANLLW